MYLKTIIAAWLSSSFLRQNNLSFSIYSYASVCLCSGPRPLPVLSSGLPSLLRITELLGMEGTSGDHPAQPPAEAESPEQVAGEAVQVGLEYPQRSLFHNLSGQPIPVTPHLSLRTAPKTGHSTSVRCSAEGKSVLCTVSVQCLSFAHQYIICSYLPCDLLEQNLGTIWRCNFRASWGLPRDAELASLSCCVY